MPLQNLEDILNTEFLEEELGIGHIKSWKVSKGSNPSDNFLGSISNLEIELDEKWLNIVLKCFPDDICVQQHLVNKNIFHRELSVYRYFFSDCKNRIPNLKLPVPDFFGGRAIDYSENIDNTETKIDLLDNFLLMEDLRETKKASMSSHLQSLDLDHILLIVDRLAKLHAAGLAIQGSLDKNMHDVYPFLKKPASSLEQKQKFMEKHVEVIIEILNQANTEVPIIQAMERYKKHSGEIIFWFSQDAAEVNGLRECELEQKFMRISPPEYEDGDDYIPWRVVGHGDLWTNNVLFTYHKHNGSLEDAYFVDFQRVALDCPTLDIACLLYTSTDAQFRRNNLDEVLQKYQESLISYCSKFVIPSLPGFNLNSLRERFHRAKLYAFSMALIHLPLVLMEEGTGNDLNTLTGPFDRPLNFSPNSLLEKNVVEIVSEMYEEGVI